MSTAAPGRIYLAEQRGLTETAEFRRYSTFNFGSYAHADKGPWGRLLGLNEELLAGAQHVQLHAPADAYVIVLPVTGAVQVASDTETVNVDVEQVLVLQLPAGSRLHLTNPYTADVISLLHIWVQASVPVAAPAAALRTYDFSALDHQLAPLLAPEERPEGLRLSLGRFAGREEAKYRVQKPAAQFFAFVLAGAFEVEGRLLHEKDSLALWQCAAPIEVEALSNNALLLVLELE